MLGGEIGAAVERQGEAHEASDAGLLSDAAIGAVRANVA